MNAPDLIEPIRGWRLWGLSATRLTDSPKVEWRLQSLKSKTYWNPRKAMHAACHLNCQTVPTWDCSCGLYAYRDKQFVEPILFDIAAADPYPCVLGEVAGWGHTIVHETGWRSSQAYPLSLIVVCGDCVYMDWICRPATRVCVTQSWNGPFTRAVCDDHFSRASSQDCFSASDIESEMLRAYAIYRSSVGDWNAIGAAARANLEFAPAVA
jgi:hypothetical protein